MARNDGAGGAGADGASQVLCVSFNQDRSCLAVGTTVGVKIFSLDLGGVCVFSESSMGAVRICEMLFSSSLLVVVGTGDTQHTSPRRLRVFNTTTRQVIADLFFADTIVGVRLDKHTLVVVEPRRALVHDLSTLHVQRIIPTALNENVVVAMTADETNQPVCLLALPSGQSKGSGKCGKNAVLQKKECEKNNHKQLGVVAVHDCLNHVLVCEISAHATPIAALALSPNGRMLATASTKGTVVRVHFLPGANWKCTKSFRRGFGSAAIASLSFGPHKTIHPGVTFLAAASAKGTVHVFRVESLDDEGGGKGGMYEKEEEKTQNRLSSKIIGKASGLASAAVSLTSRLAGVALGAGFAKTASDVLDAEHSVATVHLPSCGEGHKEARASAAAQGGFPIAGTCVLRHERDDDDDDETEETETETKTVSDTSSASTSTSASAKPTGGKHKQTRIRIVAVNGDALLCEYSVNLLTGIGSLQRERCVARAEVSGNGLETPKGGEPSDGTRKKQRDRDTRAWRDQIDDTSPEDLSTTPETTPHDDLRASMSASMAQSLFK